MSSFASLKPYFRARLNAIKLDPLATKGDLEEWPDAFNVDNIPATKINRAYHIELLLSNYQGTAHSCMGFNAQVRVRAFYKGFKTPSLAVDKAAEYADSVIKECCKSTNRLTQATIKNILPSSVEIKALDNSNDNIAYLDIVFNCLVYLDPDN